MTSEPTPEVASEVLAYCSSCKMDLYAVVVNLKKDKVGKVQCLTCKKEHLFKAPKGVVEPSAGVLKTPKEQETAQATEAEWERLMAINDGVVSRAYSMKTEFGLGEKIKHTKFGDGIVDRLVYPNKIEVVFRNDVKILIHGAKPYRFMEGK